MWADGVPGAQLPQSFSHLTAASVLDAYEQNLFFFTGTIAPSNSTLPGGRIGTAEPPGMRQ